MRGVRAGLGVLVGLALVGCTGAAPEPDVGASSPRVSAEASVSASPSVPTKPTRPEAMDRDDAEGAAAAAVYFLSLHSYMKATGHTDQWREMSHHSCGFCTAALKHAESLSAGKQTYVGGEISTEITQVYARDAVTGIQPLDARLTQKPFEIREADGGLVEESEGEVVSRRLELG